MKGIENLKLVLLAVLTIVNAVKNGFSGLTVLELGKVFKIQFKEIGLEIKDLKQDEILELVQFLGENGFKEAVSKRAIDNLIGSKKNSTFGLIRDLIKKK